MVMKSFCSKQEAYGDDGVLDEKYFCSSIVVIVNVFLELFFTLETMDVLVTQYYI